MKGKEMSDRQNELIVSVEDTPEKPGVKPRPFFVNRLQLDQYIIYIRAREVRIDTPPMYDSVGPMRRH